MLLHDYTEDTIFIIRIVEKLEKNIDYRLEFSASKSINISAKS